MKSKLIMACCVGFLLVLAVVPAVTLAAVPKQINYQGFLTDPDGDPVLDGDYSMAFKIYDAPIGGTLLWSETQTVTVTEGKYNIILGELTPIPPDILDDNRYLGITVAPDSEMTPRLKITSTAFSIKAGDAHKLGGMDSSQYALITEMCDWSEITGIPSCFADGIDDTGITIETDPTVPSSVKDGTSWSEVSGIPAGFADGTDDTGITTETDPTVPDSVKDGTNWSELSGIPSGFADGVDNVGMTTSSDYGRSGVASNLYEGSQTLTSRYLNDDRAETIQANTTANLLRVIQDGTGYAIDAQSDGSVAIRSESKNANGTGVAAYCSSDAGVGIFGQGGSKGVWGVSNMTGSYGVYGESTNYEGVRGVNTGTGNFGVLGSGFGAYGLHESSGNHGYLGHGSCGVFGQYGSSGNYGMFGHSGYAVYGRATVDSAVAVHGENNSTGNSGDIGGNWYGVYGESSSTEGHCAGAFKGNVKIWSKITPGDPVLELRDDGKAVCKILQITGGSDLSEGFEIRGIKEKLLPSPGMVVSIDPENPGDLMVCNKTYDRRVAGIISGAGGVKPGMLMGQKDSMADGTNPVALTGRVYCWVDTSGGSIEPGDLLTTSSTPGHAMKVCDYNRAQGAIIGKAMTSLDKGKGLLLVLVSLQ